MAIWASKRLPLGISGSTDLCWSDSAYLDPVFGAFELTWAYDCTCTAFFLRGVKKKQEHYAFYQLA